MSEPLLSLKNVSGRSVFGGSGDVPFTLDLAAGEVGVVFGGKFTSNLFRLILGIGQIETGSINIAGAGKWGKDGSAQYNQRWRVKIGYGFREKGLISNMTVYENVDLPAKYHGYYSHHPKGFLAERALHELQIPESLWNRRPSGVNWEMRKRVLMARAVVLDPDVIVFDDPSALLSSPAQIEMLKWIQSLKKRGKAILIGTDDLPVGLAMADWIMTEDQGAPVRQFEGVFDEHWFRASTIIREQLAS